MFSTREGSEGLSDEEQERDDNGANEVPVAEEERCPALARGAARPGIKIRLTFHGREIRGRGRGLVGSVGKIVQTACHHWLPFLLHLLLSVF